MGNSTKSTQPHRVVKQMMAADSQEHLNNLQVPGENLSQMQFVQLPAISQAIPAYHPQGHNGNWQLPN